ncbi:DUF2332 domain-containing protein [Lacisediminihabitans changchengi]|uniref:DUF2332 domain-containing protein n=1 Tax=Lacisediminihabitans changchengi TaxID=2787634 RepID=A0A934SNF8_9MICO|nr:DUF2332 domain-containing protein [Lacisediminihabitans changchengi]MBK4348222.1 DUF2332 domain-containing protein [Lacisediminihabitans changchengi]
MSKPAPAPQNGRDLTEWYTSFGEGEARGQSAVYEEWALGVAGDPGIQALLMTMPLQKRQPNLIFATSRLLGAPVGAYGPFRDWLVENFAAVAAEAEHRMTQTNEARRCASLLPALALIDGPIALLEVGASAGLCLYPDRYAYSYDDGPVLGDSRLVLESSTTGAVPIPEALPEIVWRAGVDLHPLDVLDPDDMRWLETLVWPEQHDRRERLLAAIEIAQTDPPHLVAGDAVTAVAALAAEAPDDATLVIITSGVLVYLTAAERTRFAEQVRALDARWISLEGRGALPDVESRLPEVAPAGMAGRFVLALDEHPLAFTGPHGQTLDWF